MENRRARLFDVLWWAATLAWAAVMSWFSTRTFSAEFSQSLLSRILSLVHLQLSPGTFEVVHTVLRKSAHLTEYAVLALLLLESLSTERERNWNPRRALLCIGIAAAYSLADEFHQSFVPGRTASLRDCGLDTIGAALALLVGYARRRTPPQAACLSTTC